VCSFVFERDGLIGCATRAAVDGKHSREAAHAEADEEHRDQTLRVQRRRQHAPHC
jgi:hypothetical protein